MAKVGDWRLTTRVGFREVSKPEGMVAVLSRLRQVCVLSGSRIALKPFETMKSSRKLIGCAHRPWTHICALSKPAAIQQSGLGFRA